MSFLIHKDFVRITRVVLKTFDMKGLIRPITSKVNEKVTSLVLLVF